MNSFVNSLMIFSKNPNNKNEWYFQKICKYFKESFDNFNRICRWIQMNSLMNLLMNLNEFVDEFKWICWWIQMNMLMNFNKFVDEF